jgi:hypothetical protein
MAAAASIASRSSDARGRSLQFAAKASVAEQSPTTSPNTKILFMVFFSF